MRRSVREALVGFSLLAGLAGGVGLWLWLKGVSLRQDVWTLQANFADAAGLADRSAVMYRGVQVGNVRGIKVTDQGVAAKLEISDPRLRLPRPVVARIASSSLLGGDAVVSLLSSGAPLPAAGPGPRDPGCEARRQVCDGGQVQGVSAPTLESVTETVQRLLSQAERERVVPQMAAATRAFEKTAGETEKLSRDGQVFVRDAQRLVKELNASVRKADPILANLNKASVEAATATRHARAVAARIDNPKMTEDLQATLVNARKLTDRWSAVGRDVNKLTGDPKFMEGVLSVSVGLGKFFDELYPAKVEAARDRDAREAARRQRWQQQREADAQRLAPRLNAPAVSPGGSSGGSSGVRGL
ncbi:MAG: MCE family protein [Cyanobacteria bacterium K_Offshore_surface_m2_239]|nr:MCE family protein [Cyanobacteria bacterium K_Offshore_surface_m2_239]